jgi:hypothetical protein
MDTKEVGGVNPDLAPLHLRQRAGWAAIQQGVKGKGAGDTPLPKLHYPRDITPRCKSREKFGNVAPRRQLKTDPACGISHTARAGPTLPVQGVFTFGPLVNHYSEIRGLYVQHDVKWGYLTRSTDYTPES